jgi:hypothetical protein
MAPRQELTGWDDPKSPKGPDVACPACPLLVGTRIWDGRHLTLNPHATTGYTPPNDWCPMSKGAILRYSSSSPLPRPTYPETPPWPPRPRPRT